MRNYKHSAMKFGVGITGVIFTIILALCTSCCYSQILVQLPDQIYYANDSCEYSLPDYTKVITVSDNCEVTYFYQFPESGFTLNIGAVTEVAIVAGDATGNERTIKFNVVLIDTIPPIFQVDTVLFNSLSQYQNEYKTWHLYNWITLQGDTLQSPNGFGFWGYYRNREALALASGATCIPERSIFIPLEELPDDHPLKQRDE